MCLVKVRGRAVGRQVRGHRAIFSAIDMPAGGEEDGDAQAQLDLADAYKGSWRSVTGVPHAALIRSLHFTHSLTPLLTLKLMLAHVKVAVKAPKPFILS